MAGLNVGTSNWGAFRGSPETTIPKLQPDQSQRMSRGNFRNFQGRGNQGGVNTAPSRPPVPMGGGINVGRGSMQGILPSSAPGDAFRQYASVQGGRITPPQNPYGPPSNIPTGGGAGTWGPINTAPNMPPPGMPNPYLDRGGFTGGQMPPGMGNESTSFKDWLGNTGPYSPNTGGQTSIGNESSGMTGYFNPQTRIPNMPMGNPMMNSGLRSAYGGSPAQMGGGAFRKNLFY